jgi:hypothetical protein
MRLYIQGFVACAAVVAACSSNSSSGDHADASSGVDGSKPSSGGQVGSDGGSSSGARGAGAQSTGAKAGSAGMRASGGNGAGGASSGSGGRAAGSGGTLPGMDAGDGAAGNGVAGSGGKSSMAWLTTKGNKIVTSDGKPFHGRGANLHDTRSCNACTYSPPNPDGLVKWSDELIDNWHANFIRFLLEAYPSAGGRTQWKSLVDDPGYYKDIQTVVNHMTSKPGVYVMVTLFLDPSMVPDGQMHAEWPTDSTQPVYKMLAEAFVDNPQVLFGLMNEPHDDASQNDALAAIFTKSIQTIRDVEKAHGSPQHIVVAQATQGYARDLSYWVAHPLTVEGGTNIAYETHPYNHTSDFDMLFVQPSKKIPVIIGEFGISDYQTLDEAKQLMQTAEANEVPYIAWNFHQRCPPNLLQDMGGTGYDGCGFNGAGTIYKWPPTTDWGQAVKDHLAQPW